MDESNVVVQTKVMHSTFCSHSEQPLLCADGVADAAACAAACLDSFIGNFATRLCDVNAVTGWRSYAGNQVAFFG